MDMEDSSSRRHDSRTTPKMRGNRATEMRAVRSRYGRALVPLHFNNSTSHALAKNKAVSAIMKADLKVSHKEQTRLVHRLHRTQTELHSKLITLAERQSQLAKETELRKQEETKTSEKKRGKEEEGKKACEPNNEPMHKQVESETPQEETTTTDKESQDETKYSKSVTLERQYSSTGDSANTDMVKSLPRVPNTKHTGASVRSLKEEGSMKSSRNSLNLNNNSKSINQSSVDPRKSHDLKQKVRKVRFFLPFSSSLGSKKNDSIQKKSEKASDVNLEGNHANTTGTLVTHLKADEYQGEDKLETIEETLAGAEDKEKVAAKLPATDETQEAFPTGSVSEGSVASSSHSVREKSATGVGTSKTRVKKKHKDNPLIGTTPRFQQFRTAMKTIEKYEDDLKSKHLKTQPDKQDVFPYKAGSDGKFVPLLVPYKRRTFPIPKPEDAVRRLHLLEREENNRQDRVEKSDELLDQVEKTVGTPRRKVSIMISDELVEVPHLPDIDAHAQQEEEINTLKKATRAQRAASVTISGLQRVSSQNTSQRSTSADQNYTDTAIYRLDNLKTGRINNSRKMSLLSPCGSDASSELANKNGQYRRRSEPANRNGQDIKDRRMEMTLGQLLNTMDSRLGTKDAESDSALPLRECRYIRLYSPAIKHSKAYRRASSWDMPGAPSVDYNYLMSGR